MSSPLLDALAIRIQHSINETGRCLITQAPELGALQILDETGLRRWAAEREWAVVPRLGRTQIEFFRRVPRVV